MDKYKLRAEMLNKLRTFTEEHAEMSDDDVKAYAEMEAEYDALDEQIKREERLNARLEEAKKPTTDAIINVDKQLKTNSDEYVKAFDSYLQGNFKNDMTVGVDADGGYTVPEKYLNTVLMKLNKMGRTRSISNVLKTASTVNIPVEGDSPTFTWIDEGNAYGTTSPTVDTEQIQAFKLGGIIKVSEELLQDTAINFDSYMSDQIAKGIDKAESPAFAIGDGNKKPKGYTVTAPIGASSKIASATAITGDEIIDIFYDLKEEYRATATWRMNDKTEKMVRKLKNSNGDYIYSAGMNEGERPSLLGRPIVTDNSLPDPAKGKKFIVLGDFSYYQIADRAKLSIQRLNERYADEGMVGFKVYKRVDAKVTLAEAFNAGTVKA